MKKSQHPGKTEIVVRPSHPALKIAVTVLIVFSTAALIALAWFHGAIAAETQKLADQAAAIEYANTELQDLVKDPDSVENVQKIAKDQLGLTNPKTIIIEPKK